MRQAGQAAAPRRLLARRWLTAAACLALPSLAAGGAFWLSLPSPREERLAREVVSSHVRSLMADHLLDVPSSDRHTVRPWFRGKLDFAPPAHDRAPHGFVLVGGRLDYLSDRPVAALVYRKRQHVINLFVWPSEAGGTWGGGPRTLQGDHLVHWSGGGMRYWAASDLNGEELEELAQRIQGQTAPKAGP